jgi:CheY-like chemotaxis protein
LTASVRLPIVVTSGLLACTSPSSNACKVKCEMMNRAMERNAAAVAHAARIVVVEDNRSDVFLLDRALKKQCIPFELIHLVSGGEALAFIRRQGAYTDAAIPDLILVDLNLSKYTGEDILREIRSVGHFGGIPVCVWSSSQSRRDESLLKDLGISQFITKPSGLDQFMEIGKTLKDLLAARGVV